MEFGFDEMRYGLTVWAVEPNLDMSNISKVFSDISEIFSKSGLPGKPVVEVFASGDIAIAKVIRKTADRYGINIISCGFNPSGSPHLVSPVPSEREQAYNRIIDFINFSCEVAGNNPKILTGPFYAEHMKNIGVPFSKTEHEFLTENLKRIVEYAATKDVYLAMEILNKGETNVLNTVDDGIDDIKKVGRKNLGLHLDTIHQYREEGGLDAIIPAFEKVLQAGCFYHLHLSENPRLQWGTGNIGPITPQIIQTLQSTGYKGAVVVECFHPSLDALVGIENRPAEQQNPIKVATNSLAYIAQNMPK